MDFWIAAWCDGLMVSFAIVGLGIGVAYGVFGAGGSAFATPVLALMGVPPVLAVASPLPATVPAALAGAWTYLRQGCVDRAVVTWAVLAGVPGVVVGATCTRVVGGSALLVLSALVLVGLGAGMAAGRRRSAATRVALTGRRKLAVAGLGAGAVGFATGLLANSGGFMLVPLFVLVLGLGMRTAAGTSLVVAAAMSVPAIAVHWMVGDIDWVLAGVFAAGLVPGSAIGAQVSRRVDAGRTQVAFGVVLVVFGGWFLYRIR